MNTPRRLAKGKLCKLISAPTVRQPFTSSLKNLFKVWFIESVGPYNFAWTYIKYHWIFLSKNFTENIHSWDIFYNF